MSQFIGEIVHLDDGSRCLPAVVTTDLGNGLTPGTGFVHLMVFHPEIKDTPRFGVPHGSTFQFGYWHHRQECQRT